MDTVRHQCLIYEGSPAKHLRGLANLIIRRLKANSRCMYLNSPPMVAGIRSYLAAGGLDVAQAVEKQALVLSSGQDHLVNRQFHGDKMLDMLREAVDLATADGYDGLWVSGDLGWEMGPDRSFQDEGLEKLLAYEHGLEKLFRKLPALHGICQYHADTLPAGAVRQAFETHRSVYINETISRLNPYHAPENDPRPPIPTSHLNEMLTWLQQAGKV